MSRDKIPVMITARPSDVHVHVVKVVPSFNLTTLSLCVEHTSITMTVDHSPLD